MCSFLSDLIPKRTTNETICQILKEIWIEHEPYEDSDDNVDVHNQDDSRSMTPLRSSKSELLVKHALSLKQEVMTELLSASDVKSERDDEEDELPDKLLRKVQYTLPELFENEETCEDFLSLPRSALIKIFQSDRSCASEMMFFNILTKLNMHSVPMMSKYPSIIIPKINKSSVDTNEDRHITINELEEEKFEEDETDEDEKCKINLEN